MSASPPAERSMWAGEGVSVDAVAAAVLRLQRERQRHEHGDGIARALNLVVVGSPDEEGHRIASGDASRALVLEQHLGPRRPGAGAAIVPP